MANNTDVKYRVMVVDDVKQWLKKSPGSSASVGSNGGDRFGYGFGQNTQNRNTQNQRFSSRTSEDEGYSWGYNFFNRGLSFW